MDYGVGETIKKKKSTIKLLKKIPTPLTSGIDSRVILALAKDHLDEVLLYKYYSRNLMNNSGDIKIPILLSKQLNFNYQTTPQEKLGKQYSENINEELVGMKTF